ncbi:MAG: TIGR03560 family F420-dependent LLM class oxidoreductase [Acidimicrobiaceae bacterium]|nr:TIGR03560 family F420-dependent LLM class oxidoreductase [Acidimicrobiaceae bacterium]MYB87441.1 TIGR03560 family F420-dependent LLM class oxidoreductase [Acidimicrobiaceae bacterium]
MRFGFWPSSAHRWDQILAVSQAAEASGWDGLWLPDHFMPPEGGYGHEPPGVEPELLPTHECWTLLGALAAAVPRVRLGAMVTGNTYRHPAVLAKQAATVDHVSGGRLVLGLGAGWQENEHRRYGLTFGTVRSRADMLEEACGVITSLFANERTDFDGAHYRLQGAPLTPKPLQDPLPIMIGGKGERRTIPTMVRWGHEWNGWCTVADMRYFNALIDRLCEAQDRDPATIARSAAVILRMCDSEAEAARLQVGASGRPELVGTPEQLVEQVAAYAAAGTDELIIPDFNLMPDEAPEVAERFMSEVVAAL